ncbi:unnamed protein product [Caenorhabditis angaria]|uniref:Uncharacterized protein n=1 Tax=Caenorhabditis angaria TaxID=860376 RepID=A0A9P1I7L8_9PELO|nr:unnamed protein product [Caenorhabditis angaria]
MPNLDFNYKELENYMDVIFQSEKCWGKWNMAENGTIIFEKLGFQEDECSPTNLTLFITPFNSSENSQSLWLLNG